MKKQLLFISFQLTTLVTIGQTVPNGGFETWSAQGQLEVPDGWIGSPAITKSTDANSGSFAAQVEAGDFTNPQNGQTVSVPGRLVTGVPGGGMGAPGIEGFASTSTPDSLTGWFRYIPNGSDSCIFRVTISKWNAINGTRDVLGEGMYSSFGSANYMRFSAPINYASADIPDTCTIELMSSNPQSGIQGSILWVDDVELIESLGIADSEQLGISFYPNPTTDFLHIETEFSSFDVNIMDVFGRMWTNIEINSDKIDVSQLENGIYYLVITSNSSTVLERFIKQ